MIIEITKDGETMLVALYKVYLNRRKDGLPKQTAGYFDDAFFAAEKPFSDMHPSDVTDTKCELYESGLLTLYLDGNCELTTTAIAYLENRFKNNLTEVLSFLSQFIP